MAVNIILYPSMYIGSGILTVFSSNFVSIAGNPIKRVCEKSDYCLLYINLLLTDIGTYISNMTIIWTFKV